MVRSAFYLLSVLIVASFSVAHAQDASRPRLTQADMNALTDARIGIVKAALQLTPEQTKYWPAVEDAIRARAQARYQRFAAVAERLGHGREVDPRTR